MSVMICRNAILNSCRKKILRQPDSACERHKAESRAVQDGFGHSVGTAVVIDGKKDKRKRRGDSGINEENLCRYRGKNAAQHNDGKGNQRRQEEFIYRCADGE